MSSRLTRIDIDHQPPLASLLLCEYYKGTITFRIFFFVFFVLLSVAVLSRNYPNTS